MDFRRNFPLDILSEAQAVTALIAAGVPKPIAFAQLSFVDDVQYVMDMIEAEKDNIPSLTAGDDGGDDKPVKKKKAPAKKKSPVDETVEE